MSDYGKKKWNLRKSLVTSSNMETFGMVSSWLFFIQTLLQLFAILPKEKWVFHDLMNTAFYVVYCILHAVFLFAYLELGSKLRPHWTYISGTFIYFLGYIIFTALYAGVEGADELYYGGTWLFVFGSVLFMYATRCDNYKLNPMCKQNACFWGSACFFLGSIMFAIDASSLGNSRTNVMVGLVLFVLGRIFFVRGSQSQSKEDHIKSASTTNIVLQTNV